MALERTAIEWKSYIDVSLLSSKKLTDNTGSKECKLLKVRSAKKIQIKVKE